MVLPAKWCLMGGGFLLTLWLVWQAPPAANNTTKVVAAVQPVVKRDVNKTLANTAPNQSQALLNRLSPEMVSDLFRTPPQSVSEPLVKSVNVVKPINNVLPALPFRYIGRIEKGHKMTVFVMEGEALHLLQEGDLPRADYKLEAIDLDAGELRWRYLPTQKIRNMSIQP